MKSSTPSSEAGASATNNGGTSSNRPPRLRPVVSERPGPTVDTHPSGSPGKPAPEPSARRSKPEPYDPLEPFPPWLQERDT